MPWTEWLKQQKSIFSQFWRLQIKDQHTSGVSFLLLPLSWSCRCCLCICGLLSVLTRPWCLFLFLLGPATSHRAPLILNFILSYYILKDIISKYDYILSYSGWGFNMRILEEHNSAHSSHTQSS